MHIARCSHLPILNGDWFLLQNFPKELFFVMRTVQILRGLSVGMGIQYSCVEEWEDIAREALAREHEECKFNPFVKLLAESVKIISCLRFV